MMNIIDVFGSEPRFKLGQYVFSRTSYEESDGQVAHCKTYGVIVGIEFCKEYSMYFGWVYTIEVYKTIYVLGAYKEVDANCNITATVFYESDLTICEKKHNISVIINNLKSRQLDYIARNSK